MTVTGLSPIAIAWTEVETEAMTDEEETEADTAAGIEAEETETDTAAGTKADETETDTVAETEVAETDTSDSTKSVQTGDDTPIGAWLILLLISAVILLTTGARQRSPNA